MRYLLRACGRRPCAPHTPRILPKILPSAARFRSDNTTPPPAGPEAPPFHGYLIDALDAPLHTITPLTTTPPSAAAPAPEDPAPQTAEEEKLAKARVVFGSRLAGPAERKREIEAASTNVAGVMVPPRPEEPDNCCMSGCVNCVWDVYRDEMEEWAEKEKLARRALEAQEESGVVMGMEAGEDLFEGIPVGIREFMRTEKKLKDRRRGEVSEAG